MFYYVKSLFLATFHLESDRALYLCGINLTKRSFRITESERGSFFVVFKRSLSTIKSFLKSSPTKLKTQINHDVVYDLASSSQQIRMEYLQHFTGLKLDNFIYKSELLNGSSYIEKLIITLLFIHILPFWFLATLFSKNKSSLAMFYLECLENARLLYYFERGNFKRCWFFSIYEKDANLAAYIMMQRACEVIKVPSEVPFYFFNSCILTNKLVLCNAYQKEELNVYNSTLIYDTTEFWGPEQMTKVFDIYKDKKYTIQRNTIAFYSTASWVREMEGHMDQGTNMLSNEKMLLGYLNKYINENTNVKLLIYLHPKEKKPDYLKVTQAHYKVLLPNIEFYFADFSLPSSSSFYNAEVAVAFNSTLIHERLYFGFKTIILPLDHPGFPVSNSGLSHICCFSKEQLFSKLTESLTQSEEEFFEMNQLKKYRSAELF